MLKTNAEWRRRLPYKTVYDKGAACKAARAKNAAVHTETLNFSRITAGELLPFECVAFERGLSLESDIASGICVSGDTERLKQLVSVLIDNAIRHSISGGSIALSLKCERGKVRLSVVNVGEEIPAEQKERIFERFYRADNARSDDGNFGLGLAIAKAITESHRGKIGVKCYDGKVEFYVILPQSKQ